MSGQRMAGENPVPTSAEPSLVDPLMTDKHATRTHLFC